MKYLQIELRISRDIGFSVDEGNAFHSQTLDAFCEVSKLFDGGTLVETIGWYHPGLESGYKLTFLCEDLDFNPEALRPYFKQISGINKVNCTTCIVDSHNFRLRD